MQKNLFGFDNKILHFEEVSSTNTYAKEHRDSLEHGTVILADRQTTGKGRQGKEWLSGDGNKGLGVSMSVLLKAQGSGASLYPLLCAIAVAEALEELSGGCVMIKWPNDILIDGKKLCGILCESVISAGEICVICGIGINVNQTEGEFLKDNLPYAASLRMLFGREFSCHEVVHLVLRKLEQVLQIYQYKGFAPLKQTYLNRLVNTSKDVRVIYHNRTVLAKACGIADDGSLICEKDGGQFTVNSGEASVRGVYGYV